MELVGSMYVLEVDFTRYGRPAAAMLVERLERNHHLHHSSDHSMYIFFFFKAKTQQRSWLLLGVGTSLCSAMLRRIYFPTNFLKTPPTTSQLASSRDFPFFLNKWYS